jgi:hypothetical protein
MRSSTKPLRLCGAGFQCSRRINTLRSSELYEGSNEGGLKVMRSRLIVERPNENQSQSGCVFAARLKDFGNSTDIQEMICRYKLISINRHPCRRSEQPI